MIKNAGKTAAQKAETIEKNAVDYMNSITVHITKDNGKTGIWSVNTLAGGKEHGYNGTRNNALVNALERASGESCRARVQADGHY